MTLPPLLFSKIHFIGLGIVPFLGVWMFATILYLSSSSSPRLERKDSNDPKEEKKRPGGIGDLLERQFLLFLIAILLFSIGNALLSSTFQLFAKYVCLIVDPTQISALLLSFYVFALLFMGVWNKWADSRGLLFAWSAECIIYGALMAYFFVVPSESASFGFTLGGTSLLGSAMGGFTLLPDLIIAQCAERSAADVSGLMFAARAVMVKLSGAIQSQISSRVLSDHFVPAATVQSADGKERLRWLTISLPMAFFVTAGVVGMLAHSATRKKPKKSA